MPIRAGGTAPYGPPQTILDLIEAFRNRGLQTPFTPEVLLRAGVNDSLVNRTLRSLEALELIDADGRPTEALEGLRRATTADYQTRLAAVVRGAYEEVFQFTDPATDDQTRIADAFRAYEPIGQRNRMVTLFVGLCKAAGIIPEGAPASKPAASPRPARPRTAPASTTRKTETPRVSKPMTGGGDVPPAFVGGSIHPAIQGLIASLPKNGTGWTQKERDKFVLTFGTVLDFSIPIRESEPSGWDAVPDADEEVDA